jgi:hypothetical protein
VAVRKICVPSVVLKGSNLAWRDSSLAKPEKAAAGSCLRGRDLFIRTYATELSGFQPIADEDEDRYLLDVAELRSDDSFPRLPAGCAVATSGQQP